MGRLRDKFGVILWPHGGSIGTAQRTTGQKVPYQRTAEYTALGYPDSTDDTRGGMGPDGFKMLADFVRDGGTIITEGNTATIFPEQNLTPGIKIVTNNPGLVNKGTILRGVITDMASPIPYGLDVNQMPVSFSGGGGQQGNSLRDVGIPATPDLAAQGKVDE